MKTPVWNPQLRSIDSVNVQVDPFSCPKEKSNQYHNKHRQVGQVTLFLNKIQGLQVHTSMRAFEPDFQSRIVKLQVKLRYYKRIPITNYSC